MSRFRAEKQHRDEVSEFVKKATGKVANAIEAITEKLMKGFTEVVYE